MRLLHPVIGSFLGNDYVVDVTFLQTGRCDLDELRFVLEFLDISAPKIPHAGSEAADKLINGIRQGSAIGDPSYDPFRDQFLVRICLFLEISVFAAFRSCPGKDQRRRRPEWQ